MKDGDYRDATKMAENMLFFLRSIFRTNIQCMMMFQDQNLKIFNAWVEQGLITQQEAVKMLTDWTNNTRKAAMDFRKATEENFEKLEDFFEQ